MKKLALPLVLALAACSPASPEPSYSWPTPSSSPATSTTASPTPTPTPSPTFTQSLSTDQQEALDYLIEYFRVLDLVYSDPNQEVQQVRELYSNPDLAVEEGQLVNLYRREGYVQVGTPTYHYREIGAPMETDGKTIIQIKVCIDVTNRDVIDANGKSLIDDNKSKFTEATYDMSKGRIKGWLVYGISVSEALGC